MKLITVIGGIVVAICFFFAVIFGLAASVQATTSRLATSGILFLIGIAVIAGSLVPEPQTQNRHPTPRSLRQMKAAQIKCPNCGGSINADQIKITQGVPYVKCPYCGTTFEVAEEPKW